MDGLGMPWNWQHTVCLPPGLRPPPFYCHYLPSCGAAFKQVRVCLRVFACLRVLWLSLSLAPPPGPPPVWQKSNKACSILTCCLFRRACPFSQPKRISSQVLQPLLLVEQAYNLVLVPRLTKPFSPPLYLSIHNASCWLSFV